MKRRAWKWALGIAAVVGLALGGLLWSAHSRATAVFARQDQLVKDAIAALRARPIVRAPLAEPLAGNDAPTFLDVLGEWKAIPDAALDELPSFNALPDFKPDPAKLDEFFEKHALLVERLRQSDRRRELRLGYRYEDGWAVDLPDTQTAILITKILADRADHLHQKGQSSAALESIILGLVVAHDAGRGGGVTHHLNQIVCEGIMSYRLRQMLANHDLRASDLDAFAKNLDHLRATRPSLMDALRVDDILDRRSLLNVELQGSDAPAAVYGDREVLQGRSWRYLYSRRLAYAGALDEMEQLSGEILAASSLSRALQAQASRRVGSRLEESRNPVVRRIFSAVPHLWRVDLSKQMGWTVMRTAAAVAWFESEHGKPPGLLADLVPKHLPAVPSCLETAKPLVYRDGKIWWVGRNGVDDGGKPGTHDDESDEDGDVVWTVRRK